MQELGLANLELLTSSLLQWYQQPLGHYIAEHEQKILADVLPSNSGFYQVQFGSPNILPVLKANALKLFFHLSPVAEASANNTQVCSTYTQLPLRSNSIDLVFLPHILEFEHTPRLILKEAWRILAPDGYIALVGFNPWSFWGIQSFFNKLSGFPRLQHFYSAQKIRHWITQLGAEIMTYKTLIFTSPQCLDKDFQPARTGSEKLLSALLPSQGAIYIIVAKKRIIALSPIKPSWRWQAPIIGKSFSGPAAGRLHRD